MKALPLWVRRSLAIGLALLLLLVGAALTVVPVWQKSNEYDERIAEMQRQLQRFAVQAERQEQLRADLRRLQASGAAGRFYLKGSTAALAAADLQREVKRIVRANNGNLTSTQVVPTDDDEVRRVVLRVRMRGNINAVQRAFHALETGQPYLFLDNVKVRPWGGAGLRRRAGPNADVQLDVNFDLMGYVMVETQAARST
ncbi:MAG: type II secretion system protein GspM [Gammaproteobacteria bacterium]|nr:type II secretion system protein GspM [Gammaproteobacteria bacterium]